MQITEEEMGRAGAIAKNCAWDNGKLALLIKAHRLTLAFLDGMGKEWSLTTSPLRRELENLEHFQTIRNA